MPAEIIEHRLGTYPVRRSIATELVLDEGSTMPRRVRYDVVGRRPKVGQRVPEITAFNILEIKTGVVQRATLDDLGEGEQGVHTINAFGTKYCQEGTKMCVAIGDNSLYIATNQTVKEILELADAGQHLIPDRVISTAPYQKEPESNLAPELGALLIYRPDGTEYIARGFYGLSRLMQSPEGKGSHRIFTKVQMMMVQDGRQPQEIARRYAALKT